MKKIPLRNKSGDVIAESFVDDDDYSEVMKRRWCIDKRGYVLGYLTIGPGKQRRVYLHRFLAKTPAGMATDHIDGNKLNNTKENLRVCTSGQNQWNMGVAKNNRSGVPGVFWLKHRSLWTARIGHCGKQRNLGSFKTKDEAVAVIGKARAELYGEFARKTKGAL